MKLPLWCTVLARLLCELNSVVSAPQALFRKIAAALPGMESVAQPKPGDAMEEVKLSTSTVTLEAGKAPPPASSCSC